MMQPDTMQSADIGKLTEAVCAVMAGFRGVEKSGENAFHRYKYASDADILWTLKPLLAQHGLSMMLVGFEVIHTGEVKTNRGGTERLIDLCVTYRLSHTSGQWVLVQSPGSGQDPGDKAHYKAMTGALKYAMRQTFAIPTGDDPEADAADNRGGAQQQRRQDRRQDDGQQRRQDDAPREERRSSPQDPPAEKAAAPKTDADKLAWLLGALLQLNPKFTPAFIAREWQLPADTTVGVAHIERLKAFYNAQRGATSKTTTPDNGAP